MLIRVSLLVVAATCVALAAADAAEQVDLLLVLAADVSRSVDHPKFLLQREGYASAISDPHVIDAIRSGPHQRIALSFVEWSGFGAQKLLIDWTMIDGMDAARRFGDQLLELPRSFADRTSISGGLEFGAAQMEHAFSGCCTEADESRAQVFGCDGPIELTDGTVWETPPDLVHPKERNPEITSQG